MTIITKKYFVETLATMENVLVAVGCANTREQILNEEFVTKCEGTIESWYKVEWRKCTYRGATKLTFSNGSTLCLTQLGKHNYYEVVPEGTENYFKVKKYLVQEQVLENGYKYIIYAIR